MLCEAVFNNQYKLYGGIAMMQIVMFKYWAGNLTLLLSERSSVEFDDIAVLLLIIVFTIFDVIQVT